MADAFKDRQRGEELRFEMSQELQFKTEARRNRLVRSEPRGQRGNNGVRKPFGASVEAVVCPAARVDVGRQNCDVWWGAAGGEGRGE